MNTKMLRWVLLSLAGLAGLLLPTAARAANVTVDCTGGPADFASVTAALNALDLQGPHTIRILAGPCHERIRIFDRERLTIDGSPLDALDAAFVSPVSGVGIVISIGNSRGILLRNTGALQGSNGVVIDRKSEVSIQGCRIEGNTRNGVMVVGQSLLRVTVSTHDGNGNFGMFVHQGSTVIAGNFTPGGGNNFNGNGRRGIVCTQGCTLYLAGANGVGFNGVAGLTLSTGSRASIDGTGGPNQFVGNGNGIEVFRGAAASIFNSNIIEGNPGLGLEVDGNSSTLLTDVTVRNNGEGGVSAARMSTIEFGTTGAGGNLLSGNGGANLSCDTTALIFGNLTGITNITCMRIERTLGPPRPGRIDPPGLSAHP
jgi:hypothetical protein